MAEDKKTKSTEVEELLNEKDVELHASKEKAPQKRWYIVHTYSGHENKVKVNLEKRIEYMNILRDTRKIPCVCQRNRKIVFSCINNFSRNIAYKLVK